MGAQAYIDGHTAERHAARWLQAQGYKIAALNWQDKRAEIDIVAWRLGEPVRLVEVKYRHTVRQGSGLEYITPVKLRQMQFAAQLWAAKQGYNGEYTLAAIEVAGSNFAVTSFLEQL